MPFWLGEPAAGPGETSSRSAAWPASERHQTGSGCAGDGTARVCNCSAIRAHPFASSAETYHFVGDVGQQRPLHPKDALPCSGRRATRMAGGHTGADWRQRSKGRIRLGATASQDSAGQGGAEELAESRATGKGRHRHRARGQKSPRDSNRGDRSFGEVSRRVGWARIDLSQKDHIGTIDTRGGLVSVAGRGLHFPWRSRNPGHLPSQRAEDAFHNVCNRAPSSEDPVRDGCERHDLQNVCGGP
jgi:hypothetical protein